MSPESTPWAPSAPHTTWSTTLTTSTPRSRHAASPAWCPVTTTPTPTRLPQRPCSPPSTSPRGVCDMRVSTVTEPGDPARDNEDWVTADPDLVIVLDGATARTATGCAHGIAWYARNPG